MHTAPTSSLVHSQPLRSQNALTASNFHADSAQNWGQLLPRSPCTSPHCGIHSHKLTVATCGETVPYDDACRANAALAGSQARRHDIDSAHRTPCPRPSKHDGRLPHTSAHTPGQYRRDPGTKKSRHFRLISCAKPTHPTVSPPPRHRPAPDGRALWPEHSWRCPQASAVAAKRVPRPKLPGADDTPGGARLPARLHSDGASWDAQTRRAGSLHQDTPGTCVSARSEHKKFVSFGQISLALTKTRGCPRRRTSLPPPRALQLCQYARPNSRCRPPRLQARRCTLHFGHRAAKLAWGMQIFSERLRTPRGLDRRRTCIQTRVW